MLSLLNIRKKENGILGDLLLYSHQGTQSSQGTLRCIVFFFLKQGKNIPSFKVEAPGENVGNECSLAQGVWDPLYVGRASSQHGSSLLSIGNRAFCTEEDGAQTLTSFICFCGQSLRWQPLLSCFLSVSGCSCFLQQPEGQMYWWDLQLPRSLQCCSLNLLCM